MTSLNKKITLVISLVLILLMVFVLSSCGDDEQSPSGIQQGSSQSSENLPTQSSQGDIDNPGTTDSNDNENSDDSDTPKEVTVTFVQDGFADIVKTVKYGQALTSVPKPRGVEGYNVEWESVDLSNIKGNITVNVVKTAIEYKINYVLNGGINNSSNPKTYSVEDLYKTLYAPTKTNSATFLGWYTTETFQPETKVTSISKCYYKDITLYASWLEYQIENAEGFDIDTSTTIPKISKVIPYSIENIDLNQAIGVSRGCTWKLYRDFQGYDELKLKAMSLSVGMNKAYIIVFHPDGEHWSRYELILYRLNMYNYTFMDGINKVTGGIVEEQSTVTAPVTNPSKTGYIFNGWAVGNSIVTFPYQVNTNTVFEATYKPIDYKINYIMNKGENNEENPSTYTIEENITLKKPTRQYYDFVGWYDNEDFKGSPITEIVFGNYGEKTLYAKWTPTTYNITYVLNGGANNKNNPSTYNTEQTVELNSPTRAGYTFDGWYLESSFENEATKINLGSGENKKFYAKWIANQNTIVFDSNSGNGTMENMVIATDSTVNLALNTFTKSGYTLVGWSTSPNGVIKYVDGASYKMGTNSTYTLYAVWKANENTLVFNANGGSGTMPNMTICTDASVKLIQNAFTKRGYTFMGWSTTEDGAVVYTNVAEYTMGTDSSYTLYAVWKPNENTLVFDANGGTGTVENMVIPTDLTAKLTTNVFSKLGYTFIGWSTTKGGSVEYVDGAFYKMGTESIYTLYAVWEAKLNGVTFDANGGKGTMSSLELITGAQGTLPSNTFTREGYTFIGWSTTKDGSVEYSNGANYKMGTNSTYTLYAVWKANNNTLVFNANGGSGTMPNMTICTDASVKLIQNAFTKRGYTFIGWSTTKDGQAEYVDGASYKMGTNSTYTLYAKWAPVEYTITYVISNGTNSTKNPIKYTIEDKVIFQAPSPNIGYSFYGWHFENEENAYITELPVGTVGNKTLYADIDIQRYYITYHLNGGTNSQSNIEHFTVNDLPIALEPTYKMDYTFIGWHTDSAFSTNPVNSISTVGNIELYANFEYGTEGIVYSKSGNAYTITDYIGKEPNVIIPPTHLGLSVTSIGDYAFRGCSSLTSVTIGDSVTSIGEDAFYNCTSLTSITIPNSVTSIGEYAFYNCSSLTSVTIPNSVTSIRWGAFYNCSNLTSITIPNSVTSIGDDAFYGCTSLTSITIPNSVTSIRNYAFRGCSSLTSVTIGDSVTSIGLRAFYDCPSLTSVNYLGDIASWCKISFYGYDSNPLSYANNLYLNGTLVTDLVIPDGVTSIGDYAFYNCTSLTSITIPNSVTSIGSYAFLGCTSLTSVNYLGDIASWCKISFSNYYSNPLCYANNLYLNGTLVTDLVIPDSVTSIGRYAFSGCSSLTSITIPNSVTSIGGSAFSGCTSLTSVTIPNSVTSIGSYAFYGCASLTSITIPNSVTSIGYDAFEDCSSLTIYCEASSKPSGWESKWNYSNRPVKWGHTHSYTNGSCICGAKEN